MNFRSGNKDGNFEIRDLAGKLMTAFNAEFTPEQEHIALWFYQQAYDKAYEIGFEHGVKDAQENIRAAIGLTTNHESV